MRELSIFQGSARVLIEQMIAFELLASKEKWKIFSYLASFLPPRQAPHWSGKLKQAVLAPWAKASTIDRMMMGSSLLPQGVIIFEIDILDPPFTEPHTTSQVEALRFSEAATE